MCVLTDNFHAFFLKQKVTTFSTQLMKKLLENFCKEFLLDLLYLNLKVVIFLARKIVLQQLSIACIAAVSELKARLSIN